MLADEAGIAANMFANPTVNGLSSNESIEPPAANHKPTSTTLKLGASANTKPKPVMKSSSSGMLFGHDEEENRPRRELIPLNFTDEEKHQASQYLANNALLDDGGGDGEGSARCVIGVGGVAGVNVINDALLKAQKQADALSAARSLSTSKPLTAEELERQRHKKIVDQIPISKNELFAHHVDWNSIEANNIVENTMKSWVLRKMVEYLGEEELTLTDFILSKLRSRCNPEVLLTEMIMVLDEDAEPFVVKLWRLLIFSSLKCQVN